nr:uncharacterized protein LOC110358586 isoform X2 [Columba livia]
MRNTDLLFAVLVSKASQRHCWKSLKPELFSQEPELLGTLIPEQQSRRDFMPCSLSRRSSWTRVQGLTQPQISPAELPVSHRQLRKHILGKLHGKEDIKSALSITAWSHSRKVVEEVVPGWETASCPSSELRSGWTCWHQQLEGASCLLHTGTSNSKDINNLLLLKFGLQGESLQSAGTVLILVSQ